MGGIVTLRYLFIKKTSSVFPRALARGIPSVHIFRWSWRMGPLTSSIQGGDPSSLSLLGVTLYWNEGFAPFLTFPQRQKENDSHTQSSRAKREISYSIEKGNRPLSVSLIWVKDIGKGIHLPN